MLKLYDYECDNCGEQFEALVSGYDEMVFHEPCGAPGTKIMSAPALHTLETHMRGFRPTGSDEQWASGHGGFRDVNLCNPRTGKPAVYNSLSEKKRLMKEYGVQQKEPTNDRFRKRKCQRSMIFDGSSKRTSQQGIN
jgi:putative FmdB family regulatory protein